MAKYRVGFIGCGDAQKERGAGGYAMAWSHARAYATLPERCEMVACADIVEDNAKAFAEEFGTGAVFSDYKQMLAEANLDLVSICTWPHLHAEMVIAAAEAGVNVHCEKPVADRWDAARQMVRVCTERGVQLTFSHQRRFSTPFVMAKQLLDDGQIGELVRLEGGFPWFYDMGTHCVDLMHMFNNETPVAWVIGQVDCREPNELFGVPAENQFLASWAYENGVTALVSNNPGTPVFGAMTTLVGTAGVIDVGVGDEAPLRIRRHGQSDWELIDTGGENCHSDACFPRAATEIFDCLDSGTESCLSGNKALAALEIIFACFESSRRRGRVDLPLEVDDHPLVSMIQAGQLAT